MNNTTIKELERYFKKECGEITIGDAGATTQLKLLKQDDTPLENVLISVFNLIKVNQARISRLEENLDTLASRVYNSTEDFTEDEIEEIESALFVMDIKELQEIKENKNCLQDLLYLSEEDFDVMDKKQEVLMNKIKYPTIQMHKTFNKLLNDAINNQRIILKAE